MQSTIFTRWWYHDDVSVEITWWYQDDVSVEITRCDIMMRCQSKSQNHKMMISWWCVCRNHMMMISCWCVCRNHKITRWWYHVDVSVEITKSQDDDIMLMCLSKSHDDKMMCLSKSHDVIKMMCLSKSQDDDITMRCLSKSQDDDITMRCMSKSQDDDITMRCPSKSQNQVGCSCHMTNQWHQCSDPKIAQFLDRYMGIAHVGNNIAAGAVLICTVKRLCSMSCYHLLYSPANFMLPQRRFWKTERTVGKSF